ncbi:MAG: tetratricopeptide repeat protein [Flavipsychrobacter sp.]
MTIIGTRTNFVYILALLLLVSSNSYAQKDKTEYADNKILEAQFVYFDATRAKLKGDVEEAEDLLLKVIDMDPKAGGAYYDLAYIEVQKSNIPKAKEYIKKAMAVDEDNKWYQERYGQILIQQNKYKEAAEVFKALAAKERRNRDYLELVVQLYQSANMHDEAMAVLDELMEFHANDEELLLRKQQLYLKTNQLDKAAEIADQLIKNNPEDGRYYVQLAELYANNKEDEKAIALYEKAEKLFPNDPGLKLSMAEFYKRKGNKEKYNEYVGKIFDIEDISAETQIAVLAAFLQSAVDFESIKEQAIDYAGKIAKKSPDNAAALAVYGDMLAQDNQKELAAIQYKKSLEIDPAKYIVWQNLLFTYSGPNDSDSLLKYSEKALQLFPNQAILHYMSALGYVNKKNFKKAIAAGNRAVEMQPEENVQLLSDMHALLADAYNSDKQYKLSDENFDRALELTPDNATTLNNYSYYLSERGEQLAKAEQMSKKSLELSPDQPTFLDTYGWIRYKQGKYEEAKEYVQKAIDAMGAAADGTLWDHLGDIQYKLKDINGAVSSWKKAKLKGADAIEIDKKIKACTS